MAKKLSKVTVFAPATVANLACGFDVFGLALEMPGDEVTIVPNNKEILQIKKISGDDGKLSADVNENIAAISIQAMLNELNSKQGFDIYLKKKMPLSSGLGSSAASSVAGVFAANEWMGKPYSRKELVKFAVEGERVACGTAHADNVAPSLLGGIVLCRSVFPLDIIELPVPKQLYLVVVHPHVELKTRDSREALPKMIDIKTATAQWANTAATVSALYENDFELLSRSLVDHVAEPGRSKLIPCFDDVKKSALENGALACSISGSGPSVFALVKGSKTMDQVAKAMKSIYKKANLGVDVYCSSINKKGVQVIKK
jgi:homoserine kinase